MYTLYALIVNLDWINEDGKNKYQEKRSSNNWNLLKGYIIIDPDGWDRTNFNFSWYQEEITEEEFMRRLYKSTIKLKGELK
jgi:hypothetical protein